MAATDSLHNVSQNLFTPDIVHKISEILGQPDEKTNAGLKAAVPEFLSGMFAKGSTLEGADTLVDEINTHNFESSLLPDESKLSEGNEVVNNIFGRNLNNIVAKLGGSTGLSTNTITKMLGLIAPLFMGVIGSKVKKEKLSSSGVVNFLNQQKQIIEGYSTETSDYYSLSGENPEKDLKKGRVTGFSWLKLILVLLVLGVMWFWWNSVQIKSSSEGRESAVNLFSK